MYTRRVPVSFLRDFTKLDFSLRVILRSRTCEIQQPFNSLGTGIATRCRDVLFQIPGCWKISAPHLLSSWNCASFLLYIPSKWSLNTFSDQTGSNCRTVVATTCIGRPCSLARLELYTLTLFIFSGWTMCAPALKNIIPLSTPLSITLLTPNTDINAYVNDVLIKCCSKRVREPGVHLTHLSLKSL